MRTLLLLALFCVVSTVHAAIVAVSLPKPEEIWSNRIVEKYWLKDVDGNGTVDFTLAADFIGTAIRTERSNRIAVLVSPPPDLGGPVAAFDRGNLIGSDIVFPLSFYSSAFNSDGFVEQDEYLWTGIVLCVSSGCSYSPFAGHRAYAGFEFERNGQKHYGYFDWSMAEQSTGFTLHGWAWETEPGRPIIAGAVPEPGSICLGLLSGACLLLHRRRQATS